MIETACRYEKPVRIGVNWGSLDQDLLTRLMDENSRQAEPQARARRDARGDRRLRRSTARSARESLGFGADRIVISAKVSGVQDLISVYTNLAGALRASRCTWASPRRAWAARASSPPRPASACCCSEGIGDTIRVSLTPEPGGDRTQEVIVAQEILQTMGLRSFTPMVIACPGCGRTTSTYFQELAQKIQGHIRHRMPEWRKQRTGVEDMTVAVMGCVVNGPGESKHANIGISLPGTGEQPGRAGIRGWREDRHAQGRAHRRGIPGAGRALHRAHLQRGSPHDATSHARKCCALRGRRGAVDRRTRRSRAARRAASRVDARPPMARA